MLLIDADPAMGLCMALGVKMQLTIAEARQELINSARLAQDESDKQQMAAALDYLMLEALMEFPEFSLMAMGRSESKGCYCSVNDLLRESIDALAQSFDYVIIDAEAGIEQISREVTRRVTHPVMVTDSTLRGVATALAIDSALKYTSQNQPAGIIFNRCGKPDESLLEKIGQANIPCLGCIPDDPNIARFDLEGRSLLELPPSSKALKVLADIFGRHSILL